MGHKTEPKRQLLHLVIGGEMEDLEHVEFRDLEKLDFVGAFPNYAEAREAWKGAAQRSVDNAHMRYFVIHAHRLIDPDGPQPDDDDH
jgi:myo-inositol-1(or 4)-monophosphatase